MLLALLENDVDGIVMEWKSFLSVVSSWAEIVFTHDKCNLMQLKERKASPCRANLEVVLREM